MPLHGKIVVLKRSGGDGTEFPLTASCLFGRKPDCDIRIQLPQVSKEHCRIDFNENKEVILTNLSSVNPTRVNGETLQQSERLKDGDVITIVDRSFRFEYPPPPTPKKSAKRSVAGTPNPQLKDGCKHNIRQSLESAKGKDPKVDGDTKQSETVSPFSDLYQMIRKSLDVKTPRKLSGTYTQVQRKSNVSTIEKDPLKAVKAKVFDFEAVAEVESATNATPKSDKKRKNSSQILASDVTAPGKDAEDSKSESSSPQTRQRATPQRFSISNVEQSCTPRPKSPMRRRSKEATPAKEHVKERPSPQNPKSQGSTGKGVPRKRKSAELALDAPEPQSKKKRVSFGGFLVPELFDKKLPPDSPLRKGENPRRSLCLAKPKISLLRRASVIGLTNETDSHAKSSESPKASVKKSPKGKSPSSKEPSPGKKTPKPRTPSPQKRLPKSTPASSSTNPNTPSAKASMSGEKSPKTSSRTPSPKSPKSAPVYSKWASPAMKTPKLSAQVSMSGKELPQQRSSPLVSSEKTSRTPSPKSPQSISASPAVKSPIPSTQSAKAALSAKKSPKRSSSPSSSENQSKLSTPRRTSSSSNNLETPSTKGQTYKEIPNSRKRVSPRLTPQKNVNEILVKTPQGFQAKIPSIQGRFSVSRIETPSPIAEDANVDPVRSVAVTPKFPLRRKSMKSTSHKTPLTKSAIKFLRRSGISRASIKAMSSWADTVKFGQAKVQAAVPVKKTVKSTVPTTRVAKKPAPRTQTPLRKPLGHASTGHADSPVTIVVGRAVRQKVTHPVAAAPKVIYNTAVSKKDMNMDEDLSGISEMFKTPAKEESKVLETNLSSTTKAQPVVNDPPVFDPSVLNTPEEPGEMAVSPLTLASTLKAGRYNKEAVKRLLNGSQESSFINDTSDSIGQQCTESESVVMTPNQAPRPSECLTGVKRLSKTPNQKTELVEDLRGKLLKTPKQKPEQPECLTGVKRVMKTPRQKAEPIEDLRGKLLKTPKQKPEQQECLTGVKRIMKTPRQKAEPVEDLRGELLKTPKQRPEQQEFLTGVKSIFNTPKPIESIDVQEKLFKTPSDAEVPDVSFSDAVDLLEPPAKDTQDLPTPTEETQDLPEQANMNVTGSPTDCLSGVKRIMKTPKQKHAPVESNFGIERLMKTPKERNEPVDEHFGIKQLMRSPRLRGTAPVKDFEGLQKLMEEPAEFKDGPTSGDLDVTKELDFTQEQLQDNGSSSVSCDTPDITKGATAEVLVEVQSVSCVSSEPKEVISQAVIEDAPSAPEMDTAPTESADSKKSVRGKRGKAAEKVIAKPAQDLVVSASVRGRRGKKEFTEPPLEEAKVAPKPKRGRFAKKADTVQEAVTETLPEPDNEQSLPVDIEPAMNGSGAPLEKDAVKPKRGRYARKDLEQAETVQKAAANFLLGPASEHAMTENVASLKEEAAKPKRGRPAKKALKQTEVVPELVTETSLESESDPAVTENVTAGSQKRGRAAKKPLDASTKTLPEPESDPAVTPNSPPLEEEVLKPKRGRYAKQQSSKSKQAQPAPCSEDMAKHDTAPDVKELSDDRQEQMPTEHQETKSTDSTESLQEVETAAEEHVPVVQKKAVRGRRGKLDESNAEKEEQGESISAPVRARRGMRTEATAPPKGRLTTRSRKTKEEISDVVPEKDVEINLTGTSEINTVQEDLRTTTVDSAVKPSRGRKTKHTPIDPPEPEKTLDLEQPLLPTIRKGRGRKVISEKIELKELEEVTSETKDQPKPLARGTRGRTTKNKKELENTDKTSLVAKSGLQEPTKTSRSTRKDVQTIDVEKLAPVEEEAPQVLELEQVSEDTSSIAKTRRGVRKPKQATLTPDSTENQNGPVEPEQPKKTRRAKQVENVTTLEVPEEKPELEQRQQRSRSTKTTMKDDVKQVVPSKRGRQVPTSACEEVQNVPDSAPAEPVKRGRRLLAKSSTEVNKNQSNGINESDAAMQKPQNTQRTVKWNLEVEVHDIPKRSVRAVRGKRSNPGGNYETPSEIELENSDKIEEDLSEKAAEPQPAKRARRGAKVANETESSSNIKPDDTATQPKPRRGRPAKK